MKQNRVRKLEELAGAVMIKREHSTYINDNNMHVEHYKEFLEDQIFEGKLFGQKVPKNKKQALDLLKKQNNDFEILYKRYEYKYTIPHVSQARDPRTEFFKGDLGNDLMYFSEEEMTDSEEMLDLDLSEEERLDRIIDKSNFLIDKSSLLVEQGWLFGGICLINRMFQNSKYNQADINSCNEEIAKLIINLDFTKLEDTPNIAKLAKLRLMTVLNVHEEKTHGEYTLLLKFEKKFIEKLHLYHLKIHHLRYSYTVFKGGKRNEKDDNGIMKELYIEDDKDGSKFEASINRITNCSLTFEYEAMFKDSQNAILTINDCKPYKNEPKCVSGYSIKKSINIYKKLLKELDERIMNIDGAIATSHSVKFFTRVNGSYNFDGKQRDMRRIRMADFSMSACEICRTS